MKGNDRIPITAEAVALIKSRAGDRFSPYFVTPRVIKLNSFVGKVFSPDLLNHVFANRMSLSSDMEAEIRKFRPRRVIDFGAGYTTFDMEYAISHPDCEVIEVDFPSVVSAKLKKLNEIKKEANLGRVSNLHLVPADIVQDNLLDILHDFLSEKERTLVYSVGVNTYLNFAQYNTLLHNVLGVLNNSKPGSAYLSHDPTRVQANKTSSLSGKLLRGMVSIITGSRQHIHHYTERDLKRKLTEAGFGDVDIVKRRPENTIYLARL